MCLNFNAFVATADIDELLKGGKSEKLSINLILAFLYLEVISNCYEEFT